MFTSATILLHCRKISSEKTLLRQQAPCIYSSLTTRLEWPKKPCTLSILGTRRSHPKVSSVWNRCYSCTQEPPN
jgi:hypothetical protein